MSSVLSLMSIKWGRAPCYFEARNSWSRTRTTRTLSSTQSPKIQNGILPTTTSLISTISHYRHDSSQRSHNNSIRSAYRTAVARLPSGQLPRTRGPKCPGPRSNGVNLTYNKRIWIDRFDAGEESRNRHGFYRLVLGAEGHTKPPLFLIPNHPPA